eukprot:38638_1
MNNPWKLTVTTTWPGNNRQNSTESYFKKDTRYKSYTRWEAKLNNVSTITNLKVEKADKLSLSPNDSFTVVLKIRGISEKTMGVVDCITPVVSYNPKPWLGNIKKNDIYVKVYVYEKPNGISSSNAYQAAADNYNIFMSELREIWRKQLIDVLINEKIIKENKVNEDQELSMPQMYDLCKKLHKRCKSNMVWNDMETAFNQSFGPLQSNANSNVTTNTFNTNQLNQYAYQPQQQSHGAHSHYNLRSRRQSN